MAKKNKKEIGALAKQFAYAVCDKMNEIGDEAAVEFMLGGNTDDLMVVLAAQGYHADKLKTTAEEALAFAEAYASIGEASGKSELLKEFVPAEARTEEVRNAVAKTHPKFAKLCV